MPLSKILSGDRASQAMPWYGGCIGIGWLLFWTLITGAFDVIWLWMAATQMTTWSYASTEGKVLESRIEQGTNSDGDATFDAKISYEYAVQGKTHRGETIRHFAFRMNGGRTQSEQTVERYPAGKAVTAHYSAARPETSVLETGFRGGDFFLPLFMTPFNIIMLGGWYAVLALSWRKNARPAGLRAHDDGMKVVARIYNVTPLTAAVGTTLVSSFVLTFVCGFGMMALPIDWLVPIAWCVILGSAICAWWIFRQRATTLQYDHFSGRVSIATSDGKSHAFLSSDVAAIGLSSTSSDGESTPSFSPTITYRDATGQQQSAALANWHSAEAVEWLVKWLKVTLRVKG